MKIRKSIFAAAALSLTLALGACGGSGVPSTKDDSPSQAQTQDNETEKVYKIGISQFAEHASLDNCREGFIQGLAEAGVIR